MSASPPVSPSSSPISGALPQVDNWLGFLFLHKQGNTSLFDIRRHADWVCVLVNFGCLLFAFVQALGLGEVVEALTWGVPIFLTSLAVTRAGAGNRWTMHLNGWLLVAMAALHVHLGRGMVEYHFSFFMLLPVMLMYRDPRPLITMGLMIGVHHVLFDALQRAGFNCYVFRAPFNGLPAIALHGFYILVFVGILSVLAQILRQHAQVAEETARLLGYLGGGDKVNFRVRAEVQADGQLSRFGQVFNDYADNMSFVVSAFRMLHADMRELTDLAKQLGHDNHFQLAQNTKASNTLRDFLHKLGNQTKQAQSGGELTRKLTEDCFDLIMGVNQASEVLTRINRQAFETHQQVQNWIDELPAEQSATKSRLQALGSQLDHLSERTQAFMSKMESLKSGLNAIENQAVALDRANNQALEEGHANQRQGWEVLGAMESMQNRTENAYNALNDSVQTIVRAGDVVRDMEKRLSRFDL